jgi:hypothetical protein
VKEIYYVSYDDMENYLKQSDLTLDAVVKVDVLLSDAWNISIMKEVF